MSGKTLCSTTALLLVTSVAQAAFYAGMGLGPDTVDFRQQSHVTFFNPAHPEQGFNVQDKTHLSGTGVFGTLFAGYGYLRDKYYLAVEINGNLSSTEFTSSNSEAIHGSSSASSYEIDDSFGVSLLPGFQYSPDTLFYARAAYANANFKVMTSDSSLANISKRLDGFRWGLGIRRAVGKGLGLRMEYSQTQYNSANMGTLDVLSSVVKTTHITPLQQLVEFGLVLNV